MTDRTVLTLRDRAQLAYLACDLLGMAMLVTAISPGELNREAMRERLWQGAGTLDVLLARDLERYGQAEEARREH